MLSLSCEDTRITLAGIHTDGGHANEWLAARAGCIRIYYWARWLKMHMRMCFHLHLCSVNEEVTWASQKSRSHNGGVRRNSYLWAGNCPIWRAGTESHRAPTRPDSPLAPCGTSSAASASHADTWTNHSTQVDMQRNTTCWICPSCQHKRSEHLLC